MTSPAKHTPAPWGAFFEHGIKADAYRIKANNGEWTVCMGPNWLAEWADENIANAHLIAAAPELYEALNLLLANIDTCGLDVDPAYRLTALAAVKKARGEQQRPIKTRVL